MSLGIVIANISAPFHQPAKETASASASGPASVAGTSAAVATDGLPSTADNNVSGDPNSSPAAGNQSQVSTNFTVVVLQILNDQGVVTSTIPTDQQLAAYRAGSAVPSS